MVKKNDKNRPVVIDLMDMSPDGAYFDLLIAPASLGLPVFEDMIDKEVCFRGDIRIGIDVKFIGGSYEIKTQISADAFLSCVRCLQVFEYPLESEFVVTAFDDYSKLREFSPGKLDLSMEILDDIYLNLPDYPRCNEECRGICPGCGADLNKTSCICGKIDI